MENGFLPLTAFGPMKLKSFNNINYMNCSKCKNQMLTTHSLITFATNIVGGCKIPKQDMQPLESRNESFMARKELGIPTLLSLR